MSYSIHPTGNPSATHAALAAAARSGSDDPRSLVDQFARDAAVSAHNRLDGHDAHHADTDARLDALEHGAGVADEASDTDHSADS